MGDLDHTESRKGIKEDGENMARQRHQWLWLSILGFGILLILLSNLVAGSGGWWTATILATLMLVYGWEAHRNRYVSDDTKGDGFYYLGLLFTFASLVPALIVFARGRIVVGNGDSVETMLPLIGNFGIALTTTIVGLAGRVFFAMRHDSSGDSAKNAMESTIDNIQKLGSEIGKLKSKIAKAGLGMQVLVAPLERSAKTLEEATGNIVSSFENADTAASELPKLVADFQSAVERSSGSVDGLEQRMKGTVESLDHFGITLEKSMKTLAKTLIDVEFAVAETKEAFVGAQGRAANVTTQVVALGNQAVGAREELRKMAEVFADGAKAATGSLDSVESAARRAAALEAGLDKTDKAVSTFASSVVDASARMAEATSSFREVGGHATTASKGLEGMKDAAAEALSDLASVSKVARGMRGQLTGPGSQATEQMSAAATEAGRVASELNRLTDQLSDTERGLSDITRQSAEVVKNLAEHTGTRGRLGVIGRIFGRILGRHQ